MRRSLRWLLVAGLVGLCFRALTAFDVPRTVAPESVDARPARFTPAHAPRREASQSVVAPALRVEPLLPPSLLGTDPPALTLDDRGELVVDVRLRRLFDYFLTATGELSRAELRALIRDALNRQLSGRSLAEALALLDDYLALRDAERRSRSTPPAHGTALAEHVAARHALRRHYLAPDVADAFFAADERRDALALVRAEAHAQGLLPTEVEELEAAHLTPEQRAQRAETFVLADLRAEAVGGAVPGTLVDLSAFDADAQQRLVALSARQAEFARRREAYREAQARLSNASEEDLRRLAAELGLGEREFLRLQALDTLR